MVLVPITAYAYASWSRRWMAEDAFINLRVLDQLFAGNGPVYNEGYRVEAGTSPLWLLLQALVRSVIGWAVRPEWTAVGASLVLSVGGVCGAAYGSFALTDASSRRGEPRPFYVPAGLLVVVAVPAFWDYGTSGLETGLTFGWLGGTFALLARRRRRLVTSDATSPTRPWWLAAIIGLGPLIRPELTVLSAALLVALWLLSSPGWRARTASAVIAVSLPAAYQVFRMGYYGVLTPNSAIAKEAGRSDWQQGFAYLADFIGPYRLLVPLALLVVLGVLTARRWDAPSLALAAACLGGGAIYTVFVVKVGGDYMHARMLLPPIFAMLLPVALVPVSGTKAARTVVVLGLLGTGVWALVCARSLRVEYPIIGFTDRETQIGDERSKAIGFADFEPNPVLVEDYPQFAQLARELRAIARQRQDVYISGWITQRATPLSQGRGAWVEHPMAGAIAAGTGPSVSFVDSYGTVDPVGARFEVDAEDPRPGHLKGINGTWGLAEAEWPNLRPGDPASVVLQCPEPADLLEAVHEPMSAGRFLQNIVSAPRHTTLRFSSDPRVAYEQLCASSDE